MSLPGDPDAGPLALARAYGLRVEIADLGDWGRGTLVAEYEPAGPAIRVNRRAVAALAPEQARALVAEAIAHELYHHRERLGEVPRLPTRAAREAAATAYARTLCAPDP